jgi:hypothetical protein
MMGHFVSDDMANKELKETEQLFVVLAAQQRAQEEGLEFADRIIKIRRREVDLAILQAVVTEQARTPAQFQAGVGYQAIRSKFPDKIVEVLLAESE